MPTIRPAFFLPLERPMRLRRTIRSYRNELIRRIAAIPGTPAERSQFIVLFNAAKRSHRRRRFAPRRRKFTALHEFRKLQHWIEQQDKPAAKRLRTLFRMGEQPDAANSLRRLRRKAERSSLLLSIAYVETRTRIAAIEKRALARRR